MKYISTAERIGIEKGKKEIAENLLSMGILTNEQIAQATGLTLKDITGHAENCKTRQRLNPKTSLGKQKIKKA